MKPKTAVPLAATWDCIKNLVHPQNIQFYSRNKDITYASLICLSCNKVCIIRGVASLTDRFIATQVAVAASSLLGFTRPELDLCSVFVLLEPFIT